MIRIRDTYLRWIGPIGLFLFGNVFFRLSFWLSSPPRALIDSAVVGLGAGIAFWQLNRWLIERVQDRFPGLERTRQRLGLLLLLSLVVVNAAVFSRFGLHILLGSRQYWWLGFVDYVTSLGIQLFYHVVYFTIYEGRYILRQWQQTYQEKEEITKLQWQTRFNSLKSQVNPHFLFNSLNALSALIEESPGRASQFVDELSSMYRYLLQANDQEEIELGTELKFIESYTYLLRTRHGGGINVLLDVPDTFLNRALPPLTLQLLVENAVKHNMVLVDSPLLIQISTTEAGQLKVSNNLQRRNGRVDSNGVGLSNIVARYRMLTQADVIVRDQDGQFTVLLPLLQQRA